ncbi:hypothetical protein K431DRAFT_299328 [Polychaeton citri CBS 116435]|uniref:WKF domain-containing protein n=1 Tax=Polychaeton citri CBS 116435 TaxID=1314669 RepID=A0A9P4QK49_9PEZI|nr:hypothetical protein K431DRAFT_299328 [Polychaeton citri CBS 116435]
MLDVSEPNDPEVNSSAVKVSEGSLQGITSSEALQSKHKKRKKGIVPYSEEQSQAKRSKTSPFIQPGKLPESSSAIRDSSDESMQGEHRPILRKKSVSFTAETKEEDGSSATTLSKAWFSQQQPEQPQLPATPPKKTADSTKVTTETGRQNTALDRTHSAQQPQKKKRAKDRSKSSPQEPEPAYVKYLATFHTDKQSWKFNKSKQNDLLKNIWNVYRIRPDYNDALYSYIAGLQGAAAAKRLHEGAENVLSDITKTQKTNVESMESSAARKAAYEAALERQIQTYEAAGVGRNEHDDRELEELEELRQSVERGRRALGIIDLVAEKAGVFEQSRSNPTGRSTSLSTSSVNTSNATALPNNRRKRKARTEVSSDEDTSSDSSDSDNESSDSSSSSESENSSGGSGTE